MSRFIASSFSPTLPESSLVTDEGGDALHLLEDAAIPPDRLVERLGDVAVDPVPRRGEPLHEVAARDGAQCVEQRALRVVVTGLSRRVPSRRKPGALPVGSGALGLASDARRRHALLLLRKTDHVKNVPPLVG
jgi:hypothetical protein